MAARKGSPAPKPVGDEERAEIVALLEQTNPLLSFQAIATQVGRAVGTIHKIASEQGLFRDNVRTKRANDARKAIAENRRANYVLSLMDEADVYFDAAATCRMAGDSRAAKDYVWAAKELLDRAIRIADTAKTGDRIEKARSLMEQLIAGINGDDELENAEPGEFETVEP